MYNFCTLFDSNYAAFGVTMYHSLEKWCPEFHLYIFAFDDVLPLLLGKMKLRHATVIPLKDFEDEELLRIKTTRTKGEYCWTCSSSTILYCLEKYHLDHCTYIDADLFFFANPAVLVDELGDDDVQITAHRYTEDYDQSNTSGKYCVQFMTFRNTENGLSILRWWREKCLEWCYARMEDGKFGDQKYLDDWPQRFDGVHELQHLGGGVAPWNMQQFSFQKIRREIVGTEIQTGIQFPLIFFHFHRLLCYKRKRCWEFRYTDYRLPRTARKLIYNRYVFHLLANHFRIRLINFRLYGLPTHSLETTSFFKWIKVIIKRRIQRDKGYFYWIG